MPSGSPSPSPELLALVRKIAVAVKWKLFPSAELEELVAAGNLGLCEAMQRWQPERGPLANFASRRIRGAMLDELRGWKAGTRRGERWRFVHYQGDMEPPLRERLEAMLAAPDETDYRLACAERDRLPAAERELVVLYQLGFTQEEMHAKGHSYRRIWDMFRGRGLKEGAEQMERSLTQRELECLRLAAEGLKREEIGKQIHVGGETVASHLAKARLRLGARNTTHAVALALRQGLI